MKVVWDQHEWSAVFGKVEHLLEETPNPDMQELVNMFETAQRMSLPKDRQKALNEAGLCRSKVIRDWMLNHTGAVIANSYMNKNPGRKRTQEEVLLELMYSVRKFHDSLERLFLELREIRNPGGVGYNIPNAQEYLEDPEPITPKIPINDKSEESEPRKPPKFVVVGLRGQQAQAVKDRFGSKLNARFFDNDRAPDGSLGDDTHVVLVASFLSHSTIASWERASANAVQVMGGVQRVGDKIREILLAWEAESGQ